MAIGKIARLKQEHSSLFESLVLQRARQQREATHGRVDRSLAYTSAEADFVKIMKDKNLL